MFKNEESFLNIFTKNSEIYNILLIYKFSIRISTFRVSSTSYPGLLDDCVAYKATTIAAPY